MIKWKTNDDRPEFGAKIFVEYKIPHVSEFLQYDVFEYDAFNETVDSEGGDKIDWKYVKGWCQFEDVVELILATRTF